MLGIVAGLLIILSLIFSLMNNTLPQAAAALLSSPTDTVMFCIKISGAICFFCGLFKVAEKAGITKALSRLLQPVIGKIMPDALVNEETRNAVCMNISSNILGLGNAATPFGIKAVRGMYLSNKLQVPSRSVAAFIILNTCSVQLLPTTVAAIRSAHGSLSAFDILPAVLFTQILACILGFLIVYVFYRKDIA